MAQQQTIDQPLIPGIPGGLGFTQLFHIFKAYFLFIAIVVALSVALTLALLKVVPKTYEATAAIIVDFQSEDASGAGALPSNLEASYLATQVDIITSQKVMLKVVDRLQLDQDPDLQEAYNATPQRSTLHDFIIESLAKGLALNVDDQSRVIRITYSANDPEKAANVANAVVDAYIETNRELEQEPAKALAESFREQIDRLRQRVEDAQEQLNHFQQERRLIEIEDDRPDRVDIEKQHLTELTLKLVEVESEWREATVRVRQLQEAQAKGEPITSQPEVLNSPTIQQIKDRLLDLEVQFEEIQGVLGSRHPRYVALQDEISEVRAKLIEEAGTWAESVIAEAQIAHEQFVALQAEIARQRQKVLDIKQDRSELQQYKRELESADQVYKAALGQYDKVLLGSELIKTNVGVVSWAVPPSKHVRPSKLISLILAILIGGFVGTGLALVIEFSNRRVRCKQDLEGVLDSPVLVEMH